MYFFSQKLSKNNSLSLPEWLIGLREELRKDTVWLTFPQFALFPLSRSKLRHSEYLETKPLTAERYFLP